MFVAPVLTVEGVVDRGDVVFPHADRPRHGDVCSGYRICVLGLMV